MFFYYFCTRIFSLGLAAELLMNQVIESFKAHGSHGSHGSLPTAVLDYEILRFLMRHIKGYP